MTRAVIIVDHGSRVETANRMLDDVAALLAKLIPNRVYPAHMELAEPTITQAFAAAVRDGADHVYVFPYFLSPGRHSTNDIPRLCAEAAKAHRVKYHCGEPIGPANELAELIERRVASCPEQDYRPPN